MEKRGQSFKMVSAGVVMLVLRPRDDHLSIHEVRRHRNFRHGRGLSFDDLSEGKGWKRVDLYIESLRREFRNDNIDF